MDTILVELHGRIASREPFRPVSKFDMSVLESLAFVDGALFERPVESGRKEMWRVIQAFRRLREFHNGPSSGHITKVTVYCERVYEPIPFGAYA